MTVLLTRRTDHLDDHAGQVSFPGGRVEDGDEDAVAAALDGTREVWGAILASTLTTMAVFIPVITIQEEAGQLFKDIAIAITAAVGLSLLVSVMVIPPLAARFFSASRARDAGDKPWRFATWVASIVARINEGVGRRVVVVVGVSVV
ncbi:MAG: efflux RND transporter permease subunit, partial [Proteobacteria bacterium]|nr:efflux RND transporter permease subunit [Pseudomonadota bacterium]